MMILENEPGIDIMRKLIQKVLFIFETLIMPELFRIKVNNMLICHLWLSLCLRSCEIVRNVSKDGTASSRDS